MDIVKIKDNLFKALSSYDILLKYLLLYLFLGFAFRVVLVCIFVKSLDQSIIYIFTYGLRMDIIISSFFLILISLFYSLNLLFITRILLTLFLSLYMILEVATIPYIHKFFSRPNYLFIEHLSSYVEMLNMLWQLYKLQLIVAVPVILFFTYKLSFLFKGWVKSYNIKYKTAVLPFILIILFTGARSSFDSSTPNPSYYTFSSSNLKNEIANNSLFSIFYATYLLKKEIFYDYGDMTPEKAIPNINKINNFPPKSKNLKRFQKSVFPGKKNVVLIILESFGSEHVGYLNGTKTTPNLDALTKESLYFTNMYATGSRTSWGLSSILTSLYPIPSREYIKAARSRKDFYTIAKTFKNNGYKNTFIFSGDANFDNMRGFFLSNGYDKVMGKESFDRKKHKYTWGYSDEDLYEKALDQIRGSQEPPFFLTMLTISSHEPFDYPKGRVTPYKGAKLKGFENSIKYADHCLGVFIRKLKKSGLMKNTVIALIADHSSNSTGQLDVPVNKYKIPALIIAEDFKKGVEYDKIASQIDFGPTILDVAGVSDIIPTLGSSVFQNQRNSAILLARRKNFAYLLKDKFIIYSGDLRINTYDYSYKAIRSCEKDVFDGLSYIYGSKFLYDYKEHYRVN